VLAACANDEGIDLEAVEQAQPAASTDEDTSVTAALSPLSRRDARHYLMATGLLEQTGEHHIRARGALIRRWLSANA